jgi:hypothetical protein
LAQGPEQVTLQQKSSPPEQKPLAQSLPLFAGLHDWPLVPLHAPAALHVWFAGQPPCDPAGSSPQLVPPAHRAQGPVQATLQQTPSPPEQKPPAQSAPLFAGLHAWPLAPSHAPSALHAWFAGQPPRVPSGSSPQLVPPAHLAQGPVQVTLQQTLSPPEQKPLAQSLPLFAGLHGWLLTGSQAPARLHASFAGQAPCDPAASVAQVVPPAHVAQGPAQATLQQTWSPPEQKPLAQSLPIFDGLHAWPLVPSHAPAALHVWFAGQAPCDPAGSTPQVVPPAHVAQGPAQAMAQQTLSPPEQKPLGQSLPLFVGWHGWPLPPSLPGWPPVPWPPVPWAPVPWPLPPQPTEARTITVRIVRTAARIEPSPALRGGGWGTLSGSPIVTGPSRCGVSLRPDLCSRFIALIRSPS